MTRRCTVCTHPKRDEIDKAIVAGASYRDVAGQFGLSKSAVERHHTNGHLPAALVEAQKAAKVARADDLLAEVRGLKDKAVTILEKAEKAGKLGTALQAIRETKGCVELLARLLIEVENRRLAVTAREEKWSPLVIIRTRKEDAPPEDLSDPKQQRELRDRLIYELGLLSDDSLRLVFSELNVILNKRGVLYKVADV